MDKVISLWRIPESATRKTKRGGKKNKKKESTTETANILKLFYCNVNGLISKRESLNQSISIAIPDIVGLCETKLGALSEPKIPGYEAAYHNLKQGKEGLLVAAKEGTFKSMEKVTMDTEDRNVLAVQITLQPIIIGGGNLRILDFLGSTLDF